MTRVERRKQDTRARILAAAETLMRANPVDTVTIQDITEAADVGHGSFYLHFKSKYEVLVPIVQSWAANMDARLARVLRGVKDPAKIMATSARHMGRLIVRDPLWRWFLEHSGVPVAEIRRAVGRFSGRDFDDGLESGRFVVNEPVAMSSYAFGGFVSCLMSAFDLPDPDQRIDDAVELMLRVFGLAPGEAKAIAHHPLADLEREQ